MTNTEKIREKAASLGFDVCGIARSRRLEGASVRFAQWLNEGYDGGLGYMLRHVEKRFDPRLLVEGARSVVVCGMSYHRAPCSGAIASRIASYAHSRDYHLILRAQLGELLKTLQELFPDSTGRLFTDTAPLAEKSWAQEAGLGWIGRNSLLIHPRFGSFMLLGELVTTADLEPDEPFARDGCGNCRLCVDACPVQAILPGRMIDAGRCISRRTIESVPEHEGPLHGWLFGCDICQRVCPGNRNALLSDNPFFRPVPELAAMDAADWLKLSETDFQKIFGETPLSRCGLDRLQRRIRAVFTEHPGPPEK